MANHMTTRYGGKQGSFSASLDQWVQQTKDDLEELFRAVTIEIGCSVIRMSPVDTGRFRGEWQFTIDSPAVAQNGRIDPTPTGSDGGEAQFEVIEGAIMLQVGHTAYITNLLPYSIPLEYGHSVQAPNGMVRLTMARVQEIVRQEVERIRAKQ